MRPLIDTTVVTMTVAISDEDLRARLMEAALDGLGLLRDGQPAPGVTAKVLVGEHGEPGKKGFRVVIIRDMAQDTTPRLTQGLTREGGT